MLDIKSLKYFIAAYEERSISAAALRCFIAQPSISHAIKNLEGRLETSLFQRSRTGLVPTSSAHHLYEKAQNLLQYSMDIENHFKHTNTTHVNIYFQGDVPVSQLKPLIDTLKSNHGYQLVWVSKLNQADIAIQDKEFIGKRFTEFPLFNESFKVIAPANHILANKTKIALSDIHNLEFIERPYCSQRKQFQDLLTRQKVNIKMSAQADNDLQVLELVELGFGLAAMPSKRLTNLPQSMKAIEVDIQHQREVVLAVRTSRQELIKDTSQLNWQWLLQKIST